MYTCTDFFTANKLLPPPIIAANHSNAETNTNSESFVRLGDTLSLICKLRVDSGQLVNLLWSATTVRTFHALFLKVLHLVWMLIWFFTRLKLYSAFFHLLMISLSWFNSFKPHCDLMLLCVVKFRLIHKCISSEDKNLENIQDLMTLYLRLRAAFSIKIMTTS